MDQAENSIGPTADSLADDIDERREMPRCAVDLPVTLVLLPQGSMMIGRMTELSLGGCRLLLPKALLRAAKAAVECTFKVRGAGFRLGGVVDWVQNSLVRVQFTTMSSHTRDDLVEVLCEVELENNASLLASAHSAAQRPAAETASVSPAIETILAEAAARIPAQPSLNGAAWNPFAGMAIGALGRRASALRPEAARSQISPVPTSSRAAPIQSIATPTGMVSSPAPLTAPDAAPQLPNPGKHSPAQSNRGRDRRTSHRCGVDTSAIIHLVNVGSKLQGHILDLSVGGCRIKTLEKFPVGIYTRIEADFMLHGLPFRLGGVIQAIHGRDTVGIRFLDMSSRKKDQVAELVAELDEAGTG